MEAQTEGAWSWEGGTGKKLCWPCLAVAVETAAQLAGTGLNCCCWEATSVCANMWA